MRKVPPTDISGDEARDAARDVLAGRAFREINEPPSLQERVFDWIGNLIADLFGALSTSGGRGTAWFVIVVFAVLIVFLLSRFLKRMPALPTAAEKVDPVIAVLQGRTADEWRTQAELAEAAGDWRAAIRCRHRWMAAQLVGRGWITDRPGQTAGEIHRAIAAQRSSVDPALLDATNVFKDTWYGTTLANADTHRRFVDLAQQVLETTADAPERVAV